MIWIAAVMFKSNDILRKQTALKVCASYHLYHHQRACSASRGLFGCCIDDHASFGQQLRAEMWQYLLRIRKIMMHSCSTAIASPSVTVSG
jgi:hypothetical protein